MGEWELFGFSPSEIEIIENFDEYGNEYEEHLYIEARRREYYDEFYRYLKENGENPFCF